jgi:hypothetical protein
MPSPRELRIGWRVPRPSCKEGLTLGAVRIGLLLSRVPELECVHLGVEIRSFREYCDWAPGLGRPVVGLEPSLNLMDLLSRLYWYVECNVMRFLVSFHYSFTVFPVLST